MNFIESEIESIITEYRKPLLTLLSEPKLSLGDKKLHYSLPEKGGVYRIFEKNVAWQASLYVGKTSNLRNRIYTSHLMGDASDALKRKLINSKRFNDKDAVKQYLKTQCFVQYLIIKDSEFRTSFEHFAISILKPQFND